MWGKKECRRKRIEERKVGEGKSIGEVVALDRR